MIYKPFETMSISRLGLGNMRLPTQGDKPDAPIDYDRAKQIVDLAMAQGINYYDTAYRYHSGESEPFLGRAMADYDRSSYCLATKFSYAANPDYKAVLEEQLTKLRTDYIDFYLLHAVSDDSFADYTTCGCIDYFLEQKAKGHIRHLGFSAHASVETLNKMLDLGVWDFVQIQLNYYDWFHGTARALYEILREHDIPIMVMEPAHGGMLADLPEAGRNLLLTAKPGATAASWAFRFLRTLPGIAVVLSGMSSLEQAKDNIQTFSDDKLLSEEEISLVRQVSDVIHGLYAVPCTGCRYCCADCPQQLDIPFLLTAFNEYKTGGEKSLSSWRLDRLGALPESKRPSACIGCGACTAHCPQGLDVPAYMKEMAAFL